MVDYNILILSLVLYNKKVDVMTEGLTAWEEEFNAKTYTDKLKEGL